MRHAIRCRSMRHLPRARLARWQPPSPSAARATTQASRMRAVHRRERTLTTPSSHTQRRPDRRARRARRPPLSPRVRAARATQVCAWDASLRSIVDAGDASVGAETAAALLSELRALSSARGAAAADRAAGTARGRTGTARSVPMLARRGLGARPRRTQSARQQGTHRGRHTGKRCGRLARGTVHLGQRL